MNVDLLIERARELRLESEHLVIRRMHETDMETALSHERNRDIMRWIRDPKPEAEVEQSTRGMIGPWTAKDGVWLVLVVTLRNDDHMIGIVCMRVTVAQNETLEIGYRLHPSVQRRGYATEACRALFDFLFGEIEAHKLTAQCTLENAPSWQLMEKLGMKREAQLREYSHLNGAWRDELVYGLLQCEWQKTREG